MLVFPFATAYDYRLSPVLEPGPPPQGHNWTTPLKFPKHTLSRHLEDILHFIGETLRPLTQFLIYAIQTGPTLPLLRWRLMGLLGDSLSSAFSKEPKKPSPRLLLYTLPVPPLSLYLCPVLGLTWEQLLKHLLLGAGSPRLTILEAMSL